MRLYPRREGTSVVQHGDVTYTPAPDGGFDFPDDVSSALHSFAVRGERLWEDHIERQRRILDAELDRRRDPAELYAAVARIAEAASAIPAPAPAAKGRAKAAAS